MFTKEKIIDMNNINSTLNFINNEVDVMFSGEIMMTATNHFLSYDESCFLYEHLDLINSDINKKYLLNFIAKWKKIINDINENLDNGNIYNYLLNSKEIEVIPSIFGFTRKGVELTDKGIGLAIAVAKQIEILDEKLDELAREKGFCSHRDLFMYSLLTSENNLDKKLRFQKSIDFEIGKKRNKLLKS